MHIYMCLSIYVYPWRYLYMDVTFHLFVCPQGGVCVCVYLSIFVDLLMLYMKMLLTVEMGILILSSW